jgi:hypothetical protein
VIAKHPSGGGESRLTRVLEEIQNRRITRVPDCQKPDAPPDLPTTHALMLASIEGRLAKVETAIANQNRLLLIGVLAIIGDIVKHYL